MATSNQVKRGQRGQMLLTAALSMAAVLGFTAMAIDVGLAYEDRRDLQNDADAAALAGSQHLPANPAVAEQKAEEWLTKNGITSGQIENVEVTSTLAANDTIRVEVADDFGWIFARALGLTTSDIGAQAAARVGSVSGNSNMMPWAVIQGDTDCLDANGDAIYGTDCVVKVGASDGIYGWNGALDYDGAGGGSAEYEDNILDGEVATIYCASGDFNDPCPGTIMVHDLDGNKVGGTGHGIHERLASGPACDANGSGSDDFSEVFTADTTGINDYIVVCPDSPNVIVIPIVSYSSTPVQQVQIQGWTLAYLNYYGCSSASAVPAGSCNGTGHWEVHIIPVDASYSQINGYSGAYDPGKGITIRRLVE